MATKAEVRNKALRKIRVIESGQTPETDAATDVDATYDELHAYLSKENAAYWDLDEDIPDEAVPFVVVILASMIADEFAVEEMRSQRLHIRAFGLEGAPDNGALGQLIELASNQYVSMPIEAEYF